MRSLLSLSCVLVFLVSCSAFKSATKAASDALIDCAKEDIAKPIVEAGPTLAAAVVETIARGDDGWKDLLGELGKAAGDKALACAVEAARAGLARGHFSTSDAVVRAADYEKERGWKFAPAQ